MHSFTFFVFFTIAVISAFAGYAVPKANSYAMPPAYATAPSSLSSSSDYLDSPSTYESTYSDFSTDSESSFRRRAKARAPNTRPKMLHRRPLQPIRKFKKAKH